MKFTYSLIGGFVIWCIIASQWYLFSVKGLLSDPSHFKPHETTMAIIEILVMLLVAVLLGFGIAWYLRQGSIDKNQSDLTTLLEERKDLLALSLASKEQANRAEQKLTRAQQTFKSDFQTIEQEKERIRAEQEPLHSELIHQKEELQILRPKAQLAEIELGRITFQLKQLENQLAESKAANQKLMSESEESKSAKAHSRKDPVFSNGNVGPHRGFSVGSEKQKDDLQMISGIGPVIETKLNAVGIYTFRQISEFTPEAIDYVTSAIKFFPNRIGRDNWIGQAAALARHRK